MAMSRAVGKELFLVGFLTLGLMGCGGSDKAKPAALAPAKTATPTTTMLSAPPTTVLGAPSSYALPPSWPTDPAQADLVYVQHVLDGYSAVEAMAIKAMTATDTVNDEAQTFIAEYAYDEEMVGLEIEGIRKNLDTWPGQTLPGRIHYIVNSVISIAPQCFVAQVTEIRWEVRAAAKRPRELYVWMRIPPDSRLTDVNPSPWRILGYGPVAKYTERPDRCSLEVD